MTQHYSRFEAEQTAVVLLAATIRLNQNLDNRRRQMFCQILDCDRVVLSVES
jgi:hypothetical protein